MPSRARLPALLAVILLASFLGPSQGFAPTPPSLAEAPEPFLEPHPVVVLSDRLVCSLLGERETAFGIEGMDSAGTVEVDGVVYWTFGDTVLADGGMLPNLVGRSEDDDASDCIVFAPKEQDGRPAPLLPQELGSEQTVWPRGTEAVVPGRVHFYYASVVSDPELAWRVTGVGIASFDTETLTAERALDGALVWTDDLPVPTRTFADESYVYVFHDISRAPWTKDTILARVPKGSIESPASYEYWDAGGPGRPGRWVQGLWNEETGSWDEALADLAPLWRQGGMHNGIEVAYNEYLGRWLAVYATGFMTSVNVRTADELTGPWDATETVLVNCPTFHAPPYRLFVCYSGTQLASYTRDGGRTIYVSYSNSDAYQPYLHEIRLAAPISQWSDERGRTIYLAGDARGPSGFAPDGLTFYASDIPVPGLTPIHRWENVDSGAVRYSASPPEPPEEYRDLGVDFYAPVQAGSARATNALYAPVYRWSRGEQERYSPLNLASAGYARHETSFYAACPDADGDTLTDCYESFLETDPAVADTDGDGLNDGYELKTPGCNPLTPNEDYDGIDWIIELLGGTNPCVWDSGELHEPPMAASGARR